MSREAIIKKTLEELSKLPDNKLIEAADFVEFLVKRLNDQLLTEDIEKIASKSQSLSFLEEDSVIYQTKDLKERYK